MIDQRDLHCPGLEPSETSFLAIRPETPSGKKRPRRALLQSAVVILSRLHSVGRSRRSSSFGSCGGDNVTLPYLDSIANLSKERNSSRWAVWLGRYTLEKISRVLKAQLIRVIVEDYKDYNE